MTPLTDMSWFGALLLGVFGSVHCVGMCGGIVGALTVALPADVQQRTRRLLPFVFAYNAGRILSYALAGALVGALGAAVGSVALHSNFNIGHLLSAAFMIAVGLYIGGWWRGLRHLEALGARLWRRIEPFGRRFLPVQRPMQAFALGIVWGWLPCGLVYSALAFAIATADPWAGAARMLAFGAGTLPMLLVMGTAGRWLNTMLRRPRLRQVAGVLVMAMGLAALIYTPGHSHGAMPAHATYRH